MSSTAAILSMLTVVVLVDMAEACRGRLLLGISYRTAASCMHHNFVSYEWFPSHPGSSHTDLLVTSGTACGRLKCGCCICRLPTISGKA